MASVTIDASVLAAPPQGTSHDNVHQYVETLLDWRRLLDEPWVAIYMSENASTALFEDGLYPLRDALKSLFRATGIVEYDANTVAQVVDRLLQLTPTFEANFKLKDVLAEKVEAAPDILSLIAGKAMSSDLARCIVLIAILREHCRDCVPDHSVILRQATSALVKVKALVYELDHARDDLLSFPRAPELFEGTVLVCDSFRGLIQNLDECAIMNAATDGVGLRLAVRIALYKSRLARRVEPDWEDDGGFTIGAEFFKSMTAVLKATGGNLAGKTLRAIAEAVDGQNLPDTHAVRTSESGNSPQIERGEDKAVRRDIDYEHHLHYWQCPDGHIELAYMGPHNDLTMPG